MAYQSLDDLAAFVQLHRPLVLSGAGCSTASGIGDYRDHNGEWKRAAPVQHQDFITHAQTRKRYWLRSFYGWQSFGRAQPNAAHHALARLEEQQLLRGLITQNVDGLHQAAGQRQVIDLHGRLSQVVCTRCDARLSRAVMQEQLATLNPQLSRRPFQSAPDGDADLTADEAEIGAVKVPVCAACGGTLKPDVVFYGDSVPRERVQLAFNWVTAAQSILVVGSSLMVFSSFRFCRHAQQSGWPMAAINLGVSRADQWLTVRCALPCEEALPALCQRLGLPLRTG